MERKTGTATIGGRGPREVGHEARRARAPGRPGKAALALLPAAALGWLVSGAGGCGESATPAREICQWDCRCIGGGFCDQAYLEQCELLTDYEQGVAAEAGCGEALETYASCVQNASCGGISPLECSKPRDAYETCSALDPALCLPALDRIAGVLDMCDFEGQAAYDYECTEWTLVLFECAAPCYEAVSCEALVGSDPAERATYTTCVNACLGLPG